jgi:predicted CoA-binding protein
MVFRDMESKEIFVFDSNGIWNEDAARYGESKGLTVVMDRCIHRGDYAPTPLDRLIMIYLRLVNG